MRRWTIAAALAAVMAAGPALGQDQDAGPPTPEPAPEHRMLRGEVGTWDAKIKAFMGGPDAPPEVSDGVETNRMLGDLWLLSEFEGSFAGRPYTGHGQIGFDPRADRYIMSWIDSMSPTMMTLQGTYDPATQSLTMTGTAYDAMLGKEVEFQSVTRTVDEDHRVFTMSMKAPEFGDDWVKGMEIEYTRRKGDAAR